MFSNCEQNIVCYVQFILIQTAIIWYMKSNVMVACMNGF